MGSSFVTLGHDENGQTTTDPSRMVGFWIRDGDLALWLRLLALQLRPAETDKLKRELRDRWLLASMGVFIGCVPHRLEEAASTTEGMEILSDAVAALYQRLSESGEALNASTLNLLGMEGRWQTDIERPALLEIAQAFRRLLDGRVRSTAAFTDPWPGSGNWATSE